MRKQFKSGFKKDYNKSKQDKLIEYLGILKPLPKPEAMLYFRIIIDFDDRFSAEDKQRIYNYIRRK